MLIFCTAKERSIRLQPTKNITNSDKITDTKHWSKKEIAPDDKK